MHKHGGGGRAFNFDKKPLLVFWETTKACQLACKHCRAEAIPSALPGELSHEQGLALIEQIASFGAPYPILILTGGDVLMKHRLYELIHFARSKNIHVSVAPSITPLMNEDTLRNFISAGVEGMSLSLDGDSVSAHDQLRGVEGTFDKTLKIARNAAQSALTLQINTTVMHSNINQLPKIFRLVKEVGADIWEVFFLVRTGRGTAQLEPSADECEAVCDLLYLASQYGIVVRTVEGPFFRRVVIEHGEKRRKTASNLSQRLCAELRSLLGEPEFAPRAGTAGTGDGRGIVFVGHNGDVMPGGFLPQTVGNVTSTPLPELYRNAPLLKLLRRSSELLGRCGRCEYSEKCGGSRARAYAAFGSVMEEDPCCCFEPAFASA